MLEDMFLNDADPDEPMNLNDWLNVINALDMIIKAFAEVDADKPLPSDLLGTQSRVMKSASRLIKDDPSKLVDVLMRGLEDRPKKSE